MSDKPIDTMRLGAAGVAFEREASQRLRAENSRLRAQVEWLIGFAAGMAVRPSGGGRYFDLRSVRHNERVDAARANLKHVREEMSKVLDAPEAPAEKGGGE